MIPQNLQDHAQLIARLDAHAARVTADWGPSLSCRSGCSGCCAPGLTVFAVEAAAIRHWISERGLRPRSSRRSDAPALPIDDEANTGACAFLDAAGDCRIYPVRPVVCRTHGLPLAVHDEDGGLTGDVCPLNFDGGRDLAKVPGSDFLSIKTTDTLLAAIDLQFTAREGLPPGERIPLERLELEASG
jgi:uncharacterized protein